MLLLSAVVVFPYLDYFRYTNHEGGPQVREPSSSTRRTTIRWLRSRTVFCLRRREVTPTESRCSARGCPGYRGTYWANKPRTPVLFWRPTSTFPTPTCRHLCGLRPGWTSLGGPCRSPGLARICLSSTRPVLSGRSEVGTTLNDLVDRASARRISGASPTRIAPPINEPAGDAFVGHGSDLHPTRKQPRTWG